MLNSLDYSETYTSEVAIFSTLGVAYSSGIISDEILNFSIDS
jgi:hypothetical protein